MGQISNSNKVNQKKYIYKKVHKKNVFTRFSGNFKKITKKLTGDL